MSERLLIWGATGWLLGMTRHIWVKFGGQKNHPRVVLSLLIDIYKCLVKIQQAFVSCLLKET